MTTFKCFNGVNIVNPDNSINGTTSIDFTKFDYLDLSPYGGDEFTKVDSDEDIVNAFLLLGINAVIQTNSIVIFNSEVQVNINSFENPYINFTLNNTVINPLNFTLYNIVNLNQYSTNKYLFVYTNAELVEQLSTFFKVDVKIENSKIILDKYTGDLYDVPVSKNPQVPITDVNGLTIFCSFTTIIGIDFTPYGGTFVPVKNSMDIINEFSKLNIKAAVTNCLIELIEYTKTVYPVKACLPQAVTITGGNFCGSPNFQFNYNLLNEIDLAPFGGSKVAVTNKDSIINAFAVLGYTVIIANCQLLVLNKLCNQPLPTSIVGRTYSTPTAVADSFEYITVGIPYTVNLVTNDSDSQNQPLRITKINNVDVQVNQMVNLNANIYVKLIDNQTVHIYANENTVATSYSFNYTVSNTDNRTSTAPVNFTVVNTINTNVDYLQFDCNSYGEIDVVTNDIAFGALSVTEINGIPYTNPIWIIDNLLKATLLPDNKTIRLQSYGLYNGMGQVAYTVTNGGAFASGTIDYNINNSCVGCAGFEMQFNPNQCGQVCFTDLVYNNNTVDNYLIKLKMPNGSFYTLPSGVEFIIAKGIYAANGNNFNPNSCIPIGIGTYTPYILFSDNGDNLECPAMAFTVFPIPCNNNTNCEIAYDGPGGISSQLEMDLEVNQGSVLRIESFTTGNVVPDGVVVYYNGQPIWHAGYSVTCPYTTPGDLRPEYVNCVQCTYQTNVVSTNVNLPIQYVAGVNTCKIVVFGYPCAPTRTVWELSFRITC